MKAAAHPRQVERLAALREYGILDTPREQDFDELVALASEICGVPISVVNLIDADRQWFKAEVGLGVRETPLETSICSHVILEDDFVEITDTLTDPRMRDNPLCLGDPGLRFYAGVLLKGPDDLPLGTLCVLDYEPRQLTDFQRRALGVLGRQVMTQLNMRLSLARQELLHKEIDHRVKNSLASVAGMVSLQMSRAIDPALRASLETVKQRVHTISLLHEQLYQTTSLDAVNLSNYFAKLEQMLLVGAPPHIALDLSAAPVSVDSNRASALGVIVTEFVMNSTKHAFPDQRAGQIRVALNRHGEHEAELRCEDNGAGLTASESTAKSRGIGLRLIEASAARLGGNVESLDLDSGYGLRIVFPL